MRFSVSLFAMIAAVAWAAEAEAQSRAVRGSLFSERPLSAEEFEKAFGLPQAKSPAQPVTRGLSRGIGVEIGSATESAEATPDPEADAPTASVSVPIQFALGSDAIDPRSRAHLAGLAEMMRRHQTAVVVVIGHTDSQGSAESNLLLSERRAASVRKALISQGVAATQVAALGQGSSHPLIGEPLTGSRQRRVEFAVLK